MPSQGFLLLGGNQFYLPADWVAGGLLPWMSEVAVFGVFCLPCIFQISMGPFLHGELSRSTRTLPMIPENMAQVLGLMIAWLGRTCSRRLSLASFAGPVNCMLRWNLWSTDAFWSCWPIPFQLYLISCGYCDILAMEISRMFKLVCPTLDFDSPYKRCQEFWKRWHMTLTRFSEKSPHIFLWGKLQLNICPGAPTFVQAMVSGTARRGLDLYPGGTAPNPTAGP